MFSIVLFITLLFFLNATCFSQQMKLGGRASINLPNWTLKNVTGVEVKSLSLKELMQMI